MVCREVAKQLHAGVTEDTVKVNMGMRVMKEVGAKWLASLHDRFRTEKSVINGFKHIGIIEAIQSAREAPLSAEVLPSDSSMHPYKDLQLTNQITVFGLKISNIGKSLDHLGKST